MEIIVRCCGERTEKKCIEEAKKQGIVHVIRTQPFGECLKKSYDLAITFNQKWVPMIDADVLLSPGVIARAINYLNSIKNKSVFCLDGKTKDKIFLTTRRAGIHIYNRYLIPQGRPFIDNKLLKPESHVRRTMTKHGHITVVGKIVFGYHDYEQYYIDLWRKAFTQSRKLARKIRRSNIRNKWKRRAALDPDFKVILAAHDAGRIYTGDIIIDKRKNYNAIEELQKLGIKEKRPL